MKRPLILITMGDPAGVGPEVVLKALVSGEIGGVALPIVVGDKGILEKTAKTLGLPVRVKQIGSPEEAGPHTGTIQVLSLSDLSGRIGPGKPSAEGGKAAYDYIVSSTELILEGRADALVTAPVNKEVISLSGYPFSGHTELLAELSGTREFAMMLVGPKLKVCLVTTHIRLSDVPAALSIEGILSKASLTERALKDLFGIGNPRIALCSLNPHGGEGGRMGREEAEILDPAIGEAKRKGLSLEGPFPPDSLFFWAAQGKWDAVLALYHDQGLIPFKLLHFHEGVNLTLGLPFVRTSPDHGTAYDIAGKGLANPRSMIEAIRLAVRLATGRAAGTFTPPSLSP